MGGIIRDLLDEKKGIRENLEEQYFEFYVAGYTKKCQNVSVQANHALLFSDAVSINKGAKMEPSYLFPFGDHDSDTTVKLVPEPENQYDKSALIVVVTHPHDLLGHQAGTNTRMQELILGYVPKHISRIVNHNLHKLKLGRIKKVRQLHGGKNCSTKIAIPWQPAPREEDILMMDRLADLVDFED